MNICTLIGRNTKDIELKKTNSGKSVISFSLAVNMDYKNDNGTYDAHFFDCVAFEQRAEAIAKYVKKGDRLAIRGKLSARSYKRNDGSTAKVVEIIVDGFDFIESKKTDNASADTVEPHFEEIADDDDLPF